MLHKRLVFMALLFALALGSALALDNPSDETPIVALADNNIYLVSPQDGSAQLIAERDPEQDAALDEMYIYATPELSAVSPDQASIAYTARFYEVLDPAYADERDQIIGADPKDITLIDLASGTQTAITDQASHFAEAVADHRVSSFLHLTWSHDGRRLYFLTRISSLRPNRVPEILVEYYDLDAQTRNTLITLSPQTDVYRLWLYGVEEGLVILSQKDTNSTYTVTLYDPDGQMVKATDLRLTGMMDTTNGTMVSMNPLSHEGESFYGYYADGESLPIPSLLDVVSGEITALAPELSPAFLSHANPDGLRVVYSDILDYTSDSRWEVTDAEGYAIDSMSLEGLSFAWEFAISPQGDEIAMLKPGEGHTVYTPAPIVIMTPDGSRELDFKANQIVWGAIDYGFAPLLYRG